MSLKEFGVKGTQRCRMSCISGGERDLSLFAFLIYCESYISGTGGEEGGGSRGAIKPGGLMGPPDSRMAWETNGLLSVSSLLPPVLKACPADILGPRSGPLLFLVISSSRLGLKAG